MAKHVPDLPNALRDHPMEQIAAFPTSPTPSYRVRSPRHLGRRWCTNFLCWHMPRIVADYHGFSYIKGRAGRLQPQVDPQTVYRTTHSVSFTVTAQLSIKALWLLVTTDSCIIVRAAVEDSASSARKAGCGSVDVGSAPAQTRPLPDDVVCAEGAKYVDGTKARRGPNGSRAICAGSASTPRPQLDLDKADSEVSGRSDSSSVRWNGTGAGAWASPMMSRRHLDMLLACRKPMPDLRATATKA